MKLTTRRFKEVKKVIEKYHHVNDRAKALLKRGYTIDTFSNCSSVGKIHHFTKSTRCQIGYSRGYYRYAVCAIFDPMPIQEVWKLNSKTFGSLIK